MWGGGGCMGVLGKEGIVCVYVCVGEGGDGMCVWGWVGVWGTCVFDTSSKKFIYLTHN